MRLAIMEDIAAKPEAVRLRSLRRRLTALDRALTDAEADILDRLTSSMNGLSNVGCINYLKCEVRSSPSGRLPFTDARKQEIAITAHVLKGLCINHRTALLELAALLDPNMGSSLTAGPGLEFIEALRGAAKAALRLNEEYLRSRRAQLYGKSGGGPAMSLRF